MRVLAESSAIVTWLLNEPRANEVGAVLANAREVVTSSLTWIECDRVLHRYQALGGRSPDLIRDAQSRLLAIRRGWISIELTEECQRIASGDFPLEPIRTLDALHLAAAVVAQGWVGPLHVLSLDQRIRENARLLGFSLQPN